MASISACLFPSFTAKPGQIVPLNHHCFFKSPSPLFLRPATTTNKFRSISPQIRAAATSDGFPSIKPGASIESDKLPADARKRAMDAIDSSGRRVTVGDVATKSGINLNLAQTTLQALAADTNGFLEVSDEGDILYVFPKDYRSKLVAKSFWISRIEPLLDKGKMVAEYLVRVSFGTALIASIVLVYTTIIAIMSSSRDEDNRGRRGRSFDSGFMFHLSPTDLLWYWDPYYYRRRRVREGNGGMKFIESVFSFVFGDGDPNQGIEEERWKLVIIEH